MGRPCLQPSNGYQKVDFIFGNGELHFFQPIAFHFGAGQTRAYGMWPEVERNAGPRTTRFRFHNQDHVYNPQMGIQSIISYLEMKNFTF